MRNMVNQRKWILIAEDIGMGAAVFSITQLLIRIPILQNVLAYQPWFQGPALCKSLSVRPVSGGYGRTGRRAWKVSWIFAAWKKALELAGWHCFWPWPRRDRGRVGLCYAGRTDPGRHFGICTWNCCGSSGKNFGSKLSRGSLGDGASWSEKREEAMAVSSSHSSYTAGSDSSMEYQSLGKRSPDFCGRSRISGMGRKE